MLTPAPFPPLSRRTIAACHHEFQRLGLIWLAQSHPIFTYPNFLTYQMIMTNFSLPYTIFTFISKEESVDLIFLK